jgi:hypothetical protein
VSGGSPFRKPIFRSLKFREIAPVGFDGVASEAAFDTKMIEIPLDQPVGFHFGDDSQSFS